MVVDLMLTQNMISSFKECARESNYKKFVDENQNFLGTLTDNLEKVEVDKDNKLLDTISKHSKSCLTFLTDYNPQLPYDRVEGTDDIDTAIPEFIDNLKIAIVSNSWDNFYSAYYQHADTIIEEARKQGILDLQIECDQGICGTFEERDLMTLFFAVNIVGENEQLVDFEDDVQSEVEHSESSPEETITNETSDSREPNLNRVITDLETTVVVEVTSLKQFVEDSLNDHLRQVDQKLDEFQESFSTTKEATGAEMEEKLEALIRRVIREEFLKGNPNEVEQNKIFKDVECQADFSVDPSMNSSSSLHQESPLLPPAVSLEALAQDELNEPPEEIHAQHEAPRISEAPEPILPIIGEDEEMRLRQEDFQRRLAEQNRTNNERFRAVRERRLQMNREAEEERRKLTNGITRRSAARMSFH